MEHRTQAAPVTVFSVQFTHDGKVNWIKQEKKDREHQTPDPWTDFMFDVMITVIKHNHK
jgi:hypothetical protein